MNGPKTALVTGAARRIGSAIAIDLAGHGWAVAVHYNRGRKDAEAVVAEIRDGGGTAIAIAADLSDESQLQKIVPQAVDTLGPIGCLINNASRFVSDDIDTADRQSWDAHLEPNLRAPMALCQAMARALPADQHGAIVNILDQRVWNLTPHFLSYTVSKSALWTLTRTLALALAPRIRVNAIGPGPTLPSKHQTEAQFRRQWESMPLRHGPTLTEICEAIRFIVAAESMTGQMIALDGGQHLGWALPREGENHPE